MINMSILKNIKQPATITSLDELQKFYIAQIQIVDKAFEQTKLFATKTINKIAEFMSVQLPIEPVLLQEKLDVYSSYSYTIGQIVADMKSLIQIYEIIYYTPKSKEYSESDRKMIVSGKMIYQEHLLQSVINAENKLDKRITICQSILKSEMTKFIKEN